MNKKWLLSNAFVFLFLVMPAFAQEEVVELPEDELAKESVLPRFDRSVSVMNKNVVLSKRMEMGAFIGFNFAEAIFNQMKYGLSIGYHLNEDHNISFQFDSWATGFSQYGDQLKAAYSFDFNRAPRPVYALWTNWELTVYYGKISITKNTVGNLNFYPILGLGVTQYTHKMYFGINGGVGIKLYFSKSLALRTDLKAQLAQQTVPFLNNKMVPPQTAPAHSEFTEKWILGTIVDVGLVYLF